MSNILFNEAEKIREKLKQAETEPVRIGLFGAPGVGKSSLINALTGKNLTKVGVETDTTIDSGEFRWKEGMTFIDLPGYGTTKFPAAVYLEKFNVLNIDLLLFITSNKFDAVDEQFYDNFKTIEKPRLFVRTHLDSIKDSTKRKTRGQLCNEITEDARMHFKEPELSVYFVSTTDNNEGIAELSDGIVNQLEKPKAERWYREAKAHSLSFLEKKKAACEKKIAITAGLSALNALNPIPVLDIAVDLGLLINLFQEIRGNYGLADDSLSAIEKSAPKMIPIVNSITEWGTKEGIILLLKQFAKRETLKEVAKWIPFVGQVVAASAGYGITLLAGNQVNATCHELAGLILEKELTR